MAEQQGVPQSQIVGLDVAHKTVGKACLRGYSVTAAAGATEKVDITIPYKKGWDIVQGYVYVPDATSGDKFWVEALPNTDVNALLGGSLGTVGSAAAINDTAVTLAAGSVTPMRDNGLLDEGIFVRFVNTAPAVTDAAYENEIYEVTDFNATTDVLTLHKGLVAAVGVGTKVLVTRRLVHDAWLFPGVLMHVGEYSPGSSNIPQNKIIRLIYKNTGGAQVVARTNIGYMHGRVPEEGGEI